MSAQEEELDQHRFSLLFLCNIKGLQFAFHCTTLCCRITNKLTFAKRAAASVFCQCPHMMLVNTVLSVCHPCFGSAQSPTHNHYGYTCATEEKRLEV